MPIPVALPKENECQQCSSQCFGHYSSEPTVLKKSKVAPVPSILIKKAFEKYENLSASLTEKLSTKALLDPEHVKFQWEHLKQVKANRAKGVEKAKKTRAMKKMKKN